MSEFERWEGRFAQPDYVFGTAPNAFLARNAHRLKPGGRVLSVADGEGRNGVWLAEQGFDNRYRESKHDAFFKRFDESALVPEDMAYFPSYLICLRAKEDTAQEKARALARERGVELEFELSDLHARDWQEAAFDGVVGIFFQFADPAQRARIFEGIKRTLKPGGVLLIEGYGPKQLEYGTGGPKKLENLYTEELLRDAFADFTELEVTAYDAVVEEGAGHSGMSALVDLVGRK